MSGTSTSLKDEDANQIQLRLQVSEATWFGYRCMSVEAVAGGLKTRALKNGKVVTVFYPSSTFTAAEWQNV